MRHDLLHEDKGVTPEAFRKNRGKKLNCVTNTSKVTNTFKVLTQTFEVSLKLPA